MPDRFYRGMPATEAMGQLNGLNSDVQAVKDATAAGVANAAQSAAQAAAARDAAVQAWGASTAPAEQLAAISRSAHKGAVVDVFLYDTSKDSDGGAWRQRCRHTSWENEELVPGKWLGTLANFTEAWVVKGGVSGDYFQSAGGQFYQLTTSGAGGVEIYRGNTREFPALAAIVAEAGRVVIYDATKPDLPMWMVFVGIANAGMVRANISSVVAINGQMFVGCAGNQSLTEIRFVADDGFLYWTAANYAGPYAGNVAERNRGNSFVQPSSARPFIVGATINDVSTAVLPDAPIDAATGLPVSTVAIATNNGVSIIKHDGTVVNWLTQYGHALKVVISPAGRIMWSGGSGVALRAAFRNSLPPGSENNVADGWYEANSIPARPGLNTGADGDAGLLSNAVALEGEANWAFGSHGNAPLQLYRANPSTPSKSMVAHITSTYTSGWQVGDIRGAWLADTVAEAVQDGAENVSNGTFDAGTTGWDSSNGSILNAVAGKLRVQATNSYGGVIQNIPTVVGRNYVLTFETGEIINGPAISAIVRWGSNLAAEGCVANSKYALHFTADSNTVSVIFEAQNNSATVFDIDNVSVRPAEADRSVKRKGLAIRGQLIKVPVAAGAQLVAYSGFSANNYLEQPYNTDLDFGTGDFHVRGWFNKPNSALGAIFSRCTSGVINSLLLIACSANLEVYVGTGAATITAPAPPPSKWNCIDVVRLDGILSVFINGSLAGQTASTTNISHASAKLVVGAYHYTGEITIPHNGSLALWRVSATAASSDQIAQMYRDELALFQRGAQCTIAENSVVRALAYDDATDLLHVGNGWGYRSAFRGLQRVESEWLGTYGDGGAVNALSASGGSVLIGSSNTARYAQPAMLLRDELRRRRDARQAMAAVEIPLDFDSITAQTTFPLPIGFTAKGVWVAGTKKRRGPTKDYTVTFDGFRETVVFGVSPGATWVQITANRSI